MRDQQGFTDFASARAGDLRRQAYLLTGSPERAVRLADKALAETGRRWDRLGGVVAAEEHARRVVAAGSLRGRGVTPAVALTARGTAAADRRRRRGGAAGAGRVAAAAAGRARAPVRRGAGRCGGRGPRLGAAAGDRPRPKARPGWSPCAACSAGAVARRTFFPTALAETPLPTPLIQHVGSRRRPLLPSRAGRGRTPTGSPCRSGRVRGRLRWRHGAASLPLRPRAGRPAEFRPPAVDVPAGTCRPGTYPCPDASGAGSGAGTAPAAENGGGGAGSRNAGGPQPKRAGGTAQRAAARSRSPAVGRPRRPARRRSRPVRRAGRCGAADRWAHAGERAPPPRPGPSAPPAGAASAQTGSATARRAGRRRWLVAAVGVVVAGIGAAVLVPALRGDSTPDGPVPAATGSGHAQLPWTVRGPLAGDQDLLRSALRAWQSGVPDRQRPTQAAALWAGDLDGVRTVLLQGTDGTGQTWVAHVIGSGDTASLRSTEPLGRTVPLLAIGTSAGAARLLADPDTPPNGILAGIGDAFRPLAVTHDSLTQGVTVPSTGLQVVLTDDGAVVRSGTVLPGRLSPVTGTVELTRPTLDLGPAQPPVQAWYDDGELIGRRLGGPVELVQAGPVRSTSVGVSGRATKLEAARVRGGPRRHPLPGHGGPLRRGADVHRHRHRRPGRLRAGQAGRAGRPVHPARQRRWRAGRGRHPRRPLGPGHARARGAGGARPARCPAAAGAAGPDRDGHRRERVRPGRPDRRGAGCRPTRPPPSPADADNHQLARVTLPAYKAPAPLTARPVHHVGVAPRARQRPVSRGSGRWCEPRRARDSRAAGSSESARGRRTEDRQSPTGRTARAPAAAAAGAHQFRSPSSVIVAGTSRQRTSVASTTTATARAKPISLIPSIRPAANPQNTITMSSAAEVMIRPLRCSPTPDRLVVRRAGVVLLLDPGEQEDLVVHRDAEREREHDHRHPGLDRPGRGEPEQRPSRCPSWNTHDQRPERRRERDRVHHQRLDRHQHRAGHQEQQHEQRDRDHPERPRQPLGQRPGEVDAARRRPRSPSSGTAGGARAARAPAAAPRRPGTRRSA